VKSNQSLFDVGALSSALYKDLDYAASMIDPNSTSLGGVSNDQRLWAIEVMRDKFLSKYVPRADHRLDDAAYAMFDFCNEHCAKWRPRLDDLNSWQQELLGTFQKYISDFFEVDLGDDCKLSWGNIALNARSGPGVAHGSKGTSFFEKMYSGPMCGSSPFVLDLYQADIRLWAEETIADQIRSETYGPHRLIRGSKFAFVPKTNKTSRMIAIEPGINQFYQLGIGSILERRLKRFFGIDLSTQPDVNRCLARMGSVIDSTRGDGFATIDLTSASDCLSLGLCGYAIPAEALDRLLSVRSPYATVKLKGEEKTVALRMISTMGNGYTFPLQTAFFAAAAAASVSLSDGIQAMPKAWSEGHIGGLYSVFGDDIIVKPDANDRLLWLLQWMGFFPNTKKCFASGWFRESCGFDFYRGFNVRPFFLKRLSTEQDCNVAFNGIVEWAARVMVPVSNTLEVLKSFYPNGAFYVPMGEDSTAGIRIPRTIALEMVKRKDRHLQSISYQCFVAKPRKLGFRDGGKPRYDRKRPYLIKNPSGLYLSVLRGECRSGTITVRDDMTRYGTTTRISPNWDYRVESLQGWFDDYPEWLASFPRRVHLVFDCGSIPQIKKIRRAPLRK
jgi:hypothetical protein